MISALFHFRIRVLLGVIVLSACSAPTLHWPPSAEDNQALFIIGPLYEDETIEPYRNVHMLSQAIAKAKKRYRAEGTAGGSGFERIAIYNWFLNASEIEQLWSAIHPNLKRENFPHKRTPELENLLAELEHIEFSGHLLAITFDEKRSETIRYLKGMRLIYLDEDQIDVNLFLIPVNLNAPETVNTITAIVHRLISSLEYASPSYGPMGFITVEEGCYTAPHFKGEKCLDRFQISRFPVTRAQWGAIMHPDRDIAEGKSDLPAAGISWTDTQHFLERLSNIEDAAFRLPTGLEWEYACLAHRPKSDRSLPAPSGLQRVDQSSPNAFGLYDMPGNSWEWTLDPYPISDRTGFLGRLFDALFVDLLNRTIRGGSYSADPSDLNCFSEKLIPKSLGAPDIGFRIVRED